MRTLVLAAVLTVVVGCGGDGGTSGDTGTGLPPESPLVGLWEVQSGACAVAFSFDETHAWGEAIACGLPSGGTGLEENKGTFAEVAGTLSLTEVESTCPSPYGYSGATISSVSYSVSSSQLTLQDSTSVLVLSRSTPSGSGAATLGCFASDGTFTASPLAPL